MKHLKGNKNTFQKRMYCKKTEIDLSKSGTGLFPGAFYMDRHVEKVILPDDAGTVSANLFKGCINLKEVTLPIDPDIGEAAFEGCKSLTDIHISFYVGSIATNAFRGCRENIRFHADSSGINPKTLKQHIEKELGPVSNCMIFPVTWWFQQTRRTGRYPLSTRPFSSWFPKRGYEIGNGLWI